MRRIHMLSLWIWRWTKPSVAVPEHWASWKSSLPTPSSLRRPLSAATWALTEGFGSISILFSFQLVSLFLFFFFLLKRPMFGSIKVRVCKNRDSAKVERVWKIPQLACACIVIFSFKGWASGAFRHIPQVSFQLFSFPDSPKESFWILIRWILPLFEIFINSQTEHVFVLLLWDPQCYCIWR